MKRYCLFFCVILFFVPACASPQPSRVTQTPQKMTPQKTQPVSHQGPLSVAGTLAANADYVPGGYGAYTSTSLRNPAIRAVDINMNWSKFEPSYGVYNFTPLDTTANAWKNAGKRVILVFRFANQERGPGCESGTLPAWEEARIKWFCDTDLHSAIPDYFDPAFQSDWKVTLHTVASHIAAQPYKSAIQYVRLGVGLGGEGFYLTYNQDDFSTDKQRLISWGYSASAFQTVQQTMLASYKVQFGQLGLRVIYPVIKLDNDTQLQTAKWAIDQGGIGVGQQAIQPGGYSADYANINEICAYAKSKGAYIQFQASNGIGSENEIAGDIRAAENLGGRTIEWYENTTDVSAYQDDFASYQTWVNRTF